MQLKNEQCGDKTSIGATPTEAMTDDSHVEVEYLDDFDISDLDLEEILNEYFSSSLYVRSNNRIDGKHLRKV